MRCKKALIVGVIGERESTAENYARARELGRLLAKEGAIVVCGGLGGVMEGVCRGVKERGGTTIGILPGTVAEEANPFVDIPVVTGLNEARNLIIVRTAQLIIAVGGEFGTLSEMSFALKIGKPVISMNSWVPERTGVELRNFFLASSPEEAVRLAQQIWQQTLEGLRGELSSS